MATRSYAIGHHRRVFMWIGGHVLDVHTIWRINWRIPHSTDRPIPFTTWTYKLISLIN